MRARGPAVGLVVLAAGCGVVDRLADPPGLSIQQFTATPTEIGAGGSSVLNWSVEGAETSEIDNGIGSVALRGTRTVRPDRTTTYTLVARTGTSTASASVRVVVNGVSSATPTPTPPPTATPTPGGAATATPTPSGSATATPTPAVPTATPTPPPATATPAPVTCGSSAGNAGNCTVQISKPTALAAGECIELNLVTVNQACPVGFGTVRSLRFDLTAHTSRTGLTWRRAVASADVLEPATGAVSSNGTTSVLATDTVLDSTVTIEIVQGGSVILSFTLRHF
jgi:hypothetical protein